jgi:hypothetical protein
MNFTIPREDSLTFTDPRRQRKADHIKRRAKARPGDALGQSCVVFGCKRPVSRGEGNGVSQTWCRYHLNHRSRHGSTWAKTIAGADLEPRIMAATKWLTSNRADPFVERALGGLRALCPCAVPRCGAGRGRAADTLPCYHGRGG